MSEKGYTNELMITKEPAFYKRYSLVLMAIGLSAAFWLIDINIDLYVFGEEGTFASQVLSPEPFEIYFRVLVISLIMVLGLVSQILVSKARKSERVAMQSDIWTRAIIESVQTGIVVIDAENHKIVDVNPVAASMFGAAKSDILGRVCHKFICPAEVGKCPVSDLGQTVHNVEKCMIDAHGDCVPIMKSVVRVKLGGKDYIIDSFVDISDRKAAQEALAKSEQKYRLFADNAADVVWTLDLNTQKFTYISPSVMKLRGYTPEEAMSLSLEKTMTPSSYKNAMVEMKKGLEEERMPGIDPDRVHMLQLEEICKDGSKVFVETKVKFLRDGSGHATGLIGATRDVTERKKSEESLQKSEKKYRLLVDTANEAIMVAQDGMMKFVNRKTIELLEDYTEQEILSTPFPAFIHPDDRAMVVENYQRRMNGENLQNMYEFRVVTRNGKVKWVEINAVLMDWEGKQASLNFLSDITERKSSELALYRANSGLEARVSQTSEISKALINDIGIQRASGIIYESGWKIGLEDAVPLRKVWKGDAKAFAEDIFERRSAAVSMQVTLREFDAPRHYARIKVFPVDRILDDNVASDAEKAYAHGYVAAVLSVAFGKPVGMKDGIPSLGNLAPSYEIETRTLEPYETEAYRLE